MKPYSVDFRQKIIEVYEQENISIRKLAQRFQVAKSFIQKLLKQYRATGDINPQVQGGHPPIKLQGEQLITLVGIIESNNDATLEELCELLKEKTEITAPSLNNEASNSSIKLLIFPSISLDL